jgi:putative membrane protein insertion efficiency factor
MKATVLLVIRGYRRWVSPAIPARCRFTPTCSAYAGEAVMIHGATRGVGLALWRLVRCHPFHPGGYDPVPPHRSEKGEVVSGSSLSDPCLPGASQ